MEWARAVQDLTWWTHAECVVAQALQWMRWGFVVCRCWRRRVCAARRASWTAVGFVMAVTHAGESQCVRGEGTVGDGKQEPCTLAFGPPP